MQNVGGVFPAGHWCLLMLLLFLLDVLKLADVVAKLVSKIIMQQELLT